MYERLASADVQDGPAFKRRRVDIAQPPAEAQLNGHTQGRVPPAGSQTGALSADAAVADPVLLEVKDISVTAPQRKKYDLCFTKNFLYARASGTSVPVQGIVYPWTDIGAFTPVLSSPGPAAMAADLCSPPEHAFYLPVPDKSQAQYNYVLLPRGSFLPTTKQASANAVDRQQPLEPLVFTVPATAPKPGSVGGSSAKAAEAVSDTYSSLFNWALTTCLRTAGNRSCQLVTADPKLFHSVARQPHRPNEKAVHVKAFRGSKDGFLFFLPTGILWAFKKPLLFLPLDRIVAVSYTNVLRTTFNMVVELDTDVSGDGSGAVEKEVEFGMIDQEDYQGIDDTYVRRHGLADRSMAEQRKAKRELVENNKKPPADAEAGTGAAGDDADGMTELERAQHEAEQQLQDEEDEDEEDYDPGSDGDSEGEGGSSEDEDEDDDEAQGDFDEDEEDEDET